MRFLNSICLSFCAFSLASSSVFAALPMTLKDDPAMQEVVALNYLSSTLFKLKHDSNRLALQRSYDEIFNNINLKRLPSGESLSRTKVLMDQLTDMLLTEKVKQEIEQKKASVFQQTLLRQVDARTISQVAQWVQNSHLTELLGRTALSSASATAATVTAAAITAVPVSGPALLIPIAISTGTAIVGVSRSLYEDYSSYTKEIEDLDLKFTEKELKEFNENCKSYLDAYWKVLQASHISDSARLTQADFELYLKALDEENDLSRFRRLTLNEKRMQFIPEYWVKRAEAAFGLWQKKQSNKYADDIAYCLDQYQFFDGFLRIDLYKANLERMRIQTGNLSASEAYDLLNNMLLIDPDNGEKRLFAAVTALRYGDLNTSLEHLKVNLDLQQMENASHALLSKIMLTDDRSDRQLARRLNTLIQNKSTSNQELVFYYKNYLTQKAYFEQYTPEIENVHVTFSDSLIPGRSTVEIEFKNSWKLNQDSPIKASLFMKGKHYEVEDIDVDEEDHVTTLTFNHSGNLTELLGQPFSVEFRIATQFFPVRFAGIVETITVEKGRLAQYIQGIKGKIPFIQNKEEPSKTKQVLSFTLEEVCSADACFRLKQGMDQTKGITKQI